MRLRLPPLHSVGATHCEDRADRKADLAGTAPPPHCRVAACGGGKGGRGRGGDGGGGADSQ